MVNQMAGWCFGLQRSREPQRSSTPSKVGTTAVQRDRITCEPNEEGGALLFRRYSATSRITSSSTGMPNGKLATPNGKRIRKLTTEEQARAA